MSQRPESLLNEVQQQELRTSIALLEITESGDSEDFGPVFRRLLYLGAKLKNDVVPKITKASIGYIEEDLKEDLDVLELVGLTSLLKEIFGAQGRNEVFEAWKEAQFEKLAEPSNYGCITKSPKGDRENKSEKS